jgi:hypothetical protein
MGSNNTEHHATFSTHFKPTEKENSIQSNNKEKGGIGPLFLCYLKNAQSHRKDIRKINICKYPF